MWVMLNHVKDIVCKSVDWIILSHDRVQRRVLSDITVELRVVQMARNYWRVLVTIRDVQILNQRFYSFSLHRHRFQIFRLPFMTITIARKCCCLVFHHPDHTTRSLLTASALSLHRFAFSFQWRHAQRRANHSTPCLFALNWTKPRALTG